MAKYIISITVSPEVLDDMDKKRGKIPRSTYIEQLIKQDLLHEVSSQ